MMRSAAALWSSIAVEMFEKKNVEPIADKEVAEGARNNLMRDALSSAGLNNFESALNAVEDFLSELSLFDPKVAFGRASDSLFVAAAAFDSIDANNDQRLSRKELTAFAREADADSQYMLEWMLMHFDSLGKVLGEQNSEEGLSKRDLTYAGSFFRGLAFTHKNFDKIAGLDGDPALSAIDIERFLIAHEKELDPRQRQGLIQLAMYLRKLGQKEGKTGLTDEELSELDPKALWKA